MTIYLQVLAVVAILLLTMAEETAHGKKRAPSTNDIVFFAQFPGDMQKIRSSIEYSLDRYRLELATTMRNMENVCNALDIVALELPHLKAAHNKWKEDIAMIPQYYEKNENIARILLSDQDFKLVLAVTDESTTPGFSSLSSPASYDSISQLLTHIGRDWTDMGLEVRESLYRRGIIDTLRAYMPRPGGGRVLVPGAGLGRLAAELAADGFRVEANECSGAMLSSLHTILNRLLKQDHSCASESAGGAPTNCSTDLSFYPRLMYQMSDEWDFRNRFSPQRLPGGGDIGHIVEWLKARDDGSMDAGELTVQAGDFSVLYSSSDRRESFDAVVTSFFVDTAAESILVYLSNIYNVLKHGGYWLNAGPLHYHKTTNIPYSHACLEAIILASGFELLETKTVQTDYCGEISITMRPELYSIPISLYRKLEGSVNLLTTDKIERIIIAMQRFGDVGRSASEFSDLFSQVGRSLYADGLSGDENNIISSQGDSSLIGITEN